jgi:hypothetical protein
VSPTIKAHLDAIRAGAVTKTNVIGIRKAINHAERIANGWSGNRSSATLDDVFELESAAETIKPVVHGELHASGLKLLEARRYRKRLKDAGVDYIIATLDNFRLIGFGRIGRRGEYAVPIYRATSVHGQSFDFQNIPWQSGGDGPEILRVGNR